jgi:ankyrin repeat protein
VPLTELNGRAPTTAVFSSCDNHANSNTQRRETTSSAVVVVVEELFRACQQKSPSLDRIRSLVQECPAAARARRYRNYFPVTAAIASGQASLAVVRYLVHQYPPAIDVVGSDKSGTKGRNLLLHLALWSSKGVMPLDVLQYLLQLEPRLASVPDYTGWLPLHVACKTYCSSSHNSSVEGNGDNEANQQRRRLEIIQTLVQAFPDSVLVRTHDGRLPLDVLLQDAYRVRNSTTTTRNINNNAVSSSSPPPPPQLVLESVTLAATGYPPVHFACRYKCSMKTIKYLLKLDPSAVFTPTSGLSRDHDMGLLPLHCACLALAAATSSATEADAMITTPTATTTSSASSSSAAALACWTTTTTSALRVLQLLLKHNPYAASVQTAIHGETPLHFSCRSTFSSSSGGGGGDTEDDDDLSLLDILQFLVAQCPASVDAQDNMGRLPGQVLCLHSSRHASCDCLYFLLRLYPHALF